MYLTYSGNAILPISAKGQPSPDSATFNQNTSVLNDFGLDSAADLENIGNSVEPLPVLRRQELNFSPARPTPLLIINVPPISCVGSYQGVDKREAVTKLDFVAMPQIDVVPKTGIFTPETVDKIHCSLGVPK